jgi:hypothetical protein
MAFFVPIPANDDIGRPPSSSYILFIEFLLFIGTSGAGFFPNNELPIELPIEIPPLSSSSSSYYFLCYSLSLKACFIFFNLFY